MERPRTPEGDEAEVAGVEPALDGDQADRVRHVLVGDPRDCERGADRVEGERIAEPRDRALGGAEVELHLAAEERGGVEAAEDEVGIGYRRFAPTLPVSGGAGLGCP